MHTVNLQNIIYTQTTQWKLNKIQHNKSTSVTDFKRIITRLTNQEIEFLRILSGPTRKFGIIMHQAHKTPNMFQCEFTPASGEIVEHLQHFR